MVKVGSDAHLSQVFAFGRLAEHCKLALRLLVVQVLRVLVQVTSYLELAVEDLAVVSVGAHLR